MINPKPEFTSRAVGRDRVVKMSRGERKPIRMDLIIFQGAGYLVEHPLKEITKELRDAEMIDVYTPLPEYTGGGHVGILDWSFAHD